jgi:hypothetical protein
MSEKRQINFFNLKHFVFVFFFLVLLAPMFQQFFSIVTERKLEGVDNFATAPNVVIDLFLEGTFQKKFEEALDINVGFRKIFVRIYNQLNYSLFDISKAGGVIVGDENYIYVQSYVDALTGKDFRGANNIDIQIQKAIVLREELKKKDILLVFALAPGKGSFYPEFIPERFLSTINPDSTNYSYYLNAFNKNNLDVIDIKSYFLKMKDTATNLLFPKTGVHWSEYGSVLAMDTISKYFSQTLSIETPKIDISRFIKKSIIKWGDYDAANLMNVFTTIPHEELPYIEVAYKRSTEKALPKLLCISDSYFSTISYIHLPDSLFSDWTYWLYERRNPFNKKSALEFQQEIESKNIVLLLATDATLGQFPYGFIDEAYEVYAPKNKSYNDLKMREFRLFVTGAIKTVEKNKVWKKQLTESAKRKKVSLIDEIINSVLWLYNEQEIKNKRFVKK